MSSRERLVLGLFVGSFLLLQGVCGALLARRLKLNPFLWFLASMLPLVGVFALVTLQSQVVSLRKVNEEAKPFLATAFTFRTARLRLIFAMFLWLAVGALLSKFLPLPAILTLLLWLSGGAIIVGKLNSRLPDCQCCGRNLGDLFGRYGPECQDALSPGATSVEAN